jgi:hypothetical protein
MNQPHPPIPEPQPASSDEPRTQSILLPPSQRPTEQPAEPAAPPATGQFAAADDPAAPFRTTGPMDFVPGIGATERPPNGSSAVRPPSTGPSTSPGTPSPAGPRRSPRGVRTGGGRRGNAAVVPLALGVLGLVLLQVGLAPDFGSQSLWEVVPTWSVFATIAALLVLLPAVAGLTGRLAQRTAWQVGAVGLVGLAIAWVLVGLPLAASDRGFWLTAALGAAGASLWLAPGRTE